MAEGPNMRSSLRNCQPGRTDLDVFAMLGFHDSRHPVRHADRVMQEVVLTAGQRSGRVRREAGKPGASDWGRSVPMGSEVSPYTGERDGCVNSMLAKRYACDHCLGPPTREIGAFSPGRKRLVACVAQKQRHAFMIEDTQEAMSPRTCSPRNCPRRLQRLGRRCRHGLYVGQVVHMQPILGPSHARLWSV